MPPQAAAASSVVGSADARREGGREGGGGEGSHGRRERIERGPRMRGRVGARNDQQAGAEAEGTWVMRERFRTSCAVRRLHGTKPRARPACTHRLNARPALAAMLLRSTTCTGAAQSVFSSPNSRDVLSTRLYLHVECICKVSTSPIERPVLPIRRIEVPISTYETRPDAPHANG